MRFSSRLTLASHILLYLAEYQEEEKVTSEVLSHTTGANAVNVRKTLCLLKKAGLIEVRAGVGGTRLKKDSQDITLADIFDAVEDQEEQIFPMHANPNQNCPVGKAISGVMSSRIKILEEAMHQKMEGMTLKAMQEDMHRGLKQEKNVRP